jgi:hypothetical protein
MSDRDEIPAGYVRCANGRDLVVVRADLADLPPEVWWGEGDALPQARGRGDGVRVLQLATGAHGLVRGVARTYRRGGVLRALAAEQFFTAERPTRELAALVALRRAGVAAVEPLAAVAQRSGLGYRLRLVTALVDGAVPLAALAAAHPELRRRAVRRAGEVVAAALACGLRHRDLHVDNLVAVARDGGIEVFLLDLDRARLAPPLPESVRAAMLTRMARYLVRHRARLPTPASRTDALRFLAGMGYAAAARRAIATSVGKRLRRQLAVRPWLR